MSIFLEPQIVVSREPGLREISSVQGSVFGAGAAPSPVPLLSSCCRLRFLKLSYSLQHKYPFPLVRCRQSTEKVVEKAQLLSSA